MTLGIAMLSFAHVHADDYARQVQAHPEATIQCIWDDDEARGRKGAVTYGAPYESDLRAVLSLPDVDAVLINAPTVQHTELLLAAARAKKHIFTEKALTVTTADADRVVQAVRDSGVQFMISLPSRTRPETLFIKNVLDQGLLGKLTVMRCRIAHNAALDNWFHGGSAWFGDATLAGGGALFDLGCHTVDVMRWFMGEPASVIAKVQNFSGAYDIDDNCVAVVEFKNGGLGILDVSWVHRAGPNPWEIYGTEGYISRAVAPGHGLLLASKKLDIQGLPSSDLPWITPNELPEPLPMPFQQWVSACLHGTPSTISVEDGRNLTELLEGIYTAARTGAEYRFAPTRIGVAGS
jgi:1,5-anhydro-D-fructose reductase (1,5-anhydro-D-mannitol-forming)